MSFPIDPHSDLIIVPTLLSGRSGDVVARLALDTGAVRTVVSWEIAILLGYDPAAVPSRVRIITGSAVEYVPEVEFEKIESLGQQRQSFPLLCHTLPAGATVDGVLGLDFLRGQKLVIDWRAGQIELQ